MENIWQVWQDNAYCAAENMAIDAALLDTINAPMIRFYQWKKPAITIGFAQRYEQTKREGYESVRRQTGGGVVDHSNSYTYTVVFPADHKMNEEDTLACYQKINQAVSYGIEKMNYCVELTDAELGPETPYDTMACAAHPTKYDIVNEFGKISGCAQRRNLHGILHQGYIENIVGDEIQLREYILEGIKTVFQCEFSDYSKPSNFDELVANLVERQYGNEKWNKKR